MRSARSGVSGRSTIISARRRRMIRPMPFSWRRTLANVAYADPTMNAVTIKSLTLIPSVRTGYPARGTPSVRQSYPLT